MKISNIFCTKTTVSRMFLFLCALSCPAQQSWQKLQMPTAAELAKTWKAPPSEYGPEPYYGLNGPATVETIRHDLDVMKSLGFRAVTVQAGGGMLQTYLSPEYFAFFKQFISEAKKRDMRVWIVDDIGYPSGFAGGKFTTEKPALRMQALSIAQRFTVKGGETLRQQTGGNTIAAVALSSSGKRVAVPIVDSNIMWTAPAGEDWTVLVVDHVFRTSPTRSDTNPTHQKDQSQSLEDYLNPAATAAYLAFTHEQYYKAMPEEFGKTIMGFRGDEPDYSIAGLPWTPDLLDLFQQIKGYDVRPYLGMILASQAARAEVAVVVTNEELRAKADYYDVFSQMFRDGFFKPQGEWCAAHHVEYQVHLNHEEMELALVHSEGEFLRDMKFVQVPGIDTIWHQIWTDTISDFPRLAASAAHVYGHPRAFTESFAAYRPAPDITMARYILNEQMVRGVNLVETMYYPSTATPPRTTNVNVPAAPGARLGGPSAVMRDPAWPALMEYTRRVSYVMSQGRPAAQVALYLPSSSLWLGDTAADTAFVSSEQMLSERQIDFDVINNDALATDLKAGAGFFETLSGNRYRTVIVPSASLITQTELERLKSFSAGGGKVFFLGRTPSLVAGRTILDARSATPADFAFAVVENSAQLPATPTPPAQPPTAPLTPQVVPAAIEKALATVIGPREVFLDAPDPAVKLITRRLADADIYFLLNEGERSVTHLLTFRGKRHTVQWWDPETGSISAYVSTHSKDTTTVHLDLKPYETRLLVVQ
jgi:hypothetical protein